MRIKFIFLIMVLIVTSWSVAFAGSPMAGEKVWNDHACSLCHRAKGVPVIPDVPNFANGNRLMKPDHVLIMTMINGAKLMPSFKGILTKMQMIDVVTYIRTLRKQ